MHVRIVGSGFQTDVGVGTALTNMYAKTGRMEAAHSIFHEMHVHNVVS